VLRRRNARRDRLEGDEGGGTSKRSCDEPMDARCRSGVQPPCRREAEETGSNAKRLGG
jgi:hypothetical protein